MSDIERTLGTDPDPKDHSSVTAADDQQMVFYEDTPKLRGELGTLFLWSAIGLVIGAIPFLLSWGGATIHWLVYVIAIAIALICWIIPSILVRRNYYRITNYRIDFEHGLLVKKMDTLELWHVEDVSFRQGPIDRMLNVGTIIVFSHDPTNPQMPLRSVSNPRKLLETLKTRIIAVKRQRGVVKIDAG